MTALYRATPQSDVNRATILLSGGYSGRTHVNCTMLFITLVLLIGYDMIHGYNGAHYYCHGVNHRCW